jgi:Flp pilus assembly protein TadD
MSIMKAMLGFTEKHTDRYISYLLIFVTSFAFLKVTENLFLLADDPGYIFRNEVVRLGLTWRGFVWAFTDISRANWHPITWLSHMLDVQLFGLNPAGHHLVNLVIHVINTLLLFNFLSLATRSRWRSAFVAAVFAVHPLHVESVAWAAERKDLLCAMFWILSMRAYLRYAENPGWARYTAVAAFFVLGFLSKAMIVTLPFLFLLLDYWPLARCPSSVDPVEINEGKPRRFAPRPFHILVAEKLPLVAISVGVSAVAYLTQKAGDALSPLPFWIRIENVLISYVIYLWKAFWPNPLAIYYPHHGDIGKILPAWSVAAAALIIASLSVLALAERKRCPWFPVGWFWYLGTLVPVIGIVQIGGQAMADRYMYMPIAGIAIAVAWSFPETHPRLRFRNRFLAIGAATCILAFSVITWHQVGYWRDTETILKHTLSVTSDNWWAERHLGNTYEEIGKPEMAAVHYANALRISPNSRPVLKEMGRLMVRQGKTDQATRCFRMILQLYPDDIDARLGLSFALELDGKTEEAREAYAAILRTAPDLAEKRYNKGIALIRIGKTVEAIDALQDTVGLKPEFFEAHNNLGVIFAGLGKYHEAAAHFREALRLRPDYAEARTNLEMAEKDEKSGTR